LKRLLKQAGSNLTSQTASDIQEAIYKYKLTSFIENEIYPFYPQALSNQWRLGALHREWDKLVVDHDRIRILAPRDHLKTFYFSVAYLLYRLKHIEGDEIYLFSKTDKQAIKILDMIKRAIRSNPYLQTLAKGKDVDFWTKKELRTSIGSTIYAQGYNTAIRGAHPKMILLDDVIDTQVVYSDEQNTKTIERYLGDILPLAEPDTQIIIVGTLQHEADLYHSLDPDIYALRTYSAIIDEAKKQTLYPEKWNWEQLMKRKKEISYTFGERFFLREYCNIPMQLTGEIIKKEWLKFYRASELPDGTDYIGVDLSVGKDPTKGDFTAIVVFRYTKNGDYYIRHVFRARMTFAKRLKKVWEIYKAYPNIKKVRMENNTFQNDSVQVLKKDTSMPIEGIKTSKNKEQKFAEDLAPIFENGKVHILEGAEWGHEFINELLSLPRGSHDDQADALVIGKTGLGLRREPRISWV